MERFRNSFPFRHANAVEFFTGGPEYFQHLRATIDNARVEVLVQLYILESDATGIQMMNALMNAAKRGVQVFLLLDAYGSKDLSEFWIRNLENAGIKLSWYAPLSQLVEFKMGLRLHHKLIVVDRNWASCSGINWSDHYQGNTKQMPWLDFALIYQGQAVLDTVRVLRRYYPWNKKPPKNLISAHPIAQGSPDFRVLENNWFRSKLAISFYYRRSIVRANKELTIVASYFIPGAGLKRKLKQAADRGVEIKLLLGARSDIGLMKRAIRHFYPDLLKAGVRLFEYKPTVLHGKLVLVDHAELCVGSYNLNYLSDFGSVECNVLCKNEKVVRQADALIQSVLENDAIEIRLEEFLKTSSFFNRLLDRIAYGLLSWSLSILFYLQYPHSAKDSR